MLPRYQVNPYTERETLCLNFKIFNMKRLIHIDIRKVLVLTIMAVMALAPVRSLSASILPSFINLTTPNFLFDSFDGDGQMKYTSPDAYWYTITNDGFERNYDLPCTSTGNSCISTGQAGGTDYVKMTVKPSVATQSGLFQEAAVVEQKHGYVYFEPHRWSLENNKSVVFNGRMKWDGNFNADGSGNFRGSSGIFLWNLPADYVSGGLQKAKALGIILNSNHADPRVAGLGAIVYDQAYQYDFNIASYVKFTAKKTDVNLQNWVDFKMIWSQNGSGVQTVYYWINNSYLGSYELPEPFPSLAIEMWSDNQEPMDGYVNFAVQPTTTNFYVDYVTAVKL